MTHIFIEQCTATDWAVKYGDIAIHVEEYEQAAALSLKLGELIGLIRY